LLSPWILLLLEHDLFRLVLLQLLRSDGRLWERVLHHLHGQSPVNLVDVLSTNSLCFHVATVSFLSICPSMLACFNCSTGQELRALTPVLSKLTQDFTHNLVFLAGPELASPVFIIIDEASRQDGLVLKVFLRSRIAGHE